MGQPLARIWAGQPSAGGGMVRYQLKVGQVIHQQEVEGTAVRWRWVGQPLAGIWAGQPSAGGGGVSNQ